ncbi:CPBP family intramembrane metalloprotease [candidate division KSB1 bacterium]|nr:CPBP family intramembrane metalloprotease [candidate division KSB1 bacterium]
MQRLVLVFLMGVGVLAASSAVGLAIGGGGVDFEARPWLIPAVTHSAMAAVALALMALIGRGQWSQFGFTVPVGRVWGPAMWGGLGIGVVSTLVLSLFTDEEVSGTERFTFWQIVLFVWIWASACEELLVRGLLQGLLGSLGQVGFRVGTYRITLPVLFGAVFFGLMHLGLLSLGMSGAAVAVVALFAAILGGLAGTLRERSGSVIAAMVAHTSANAGGTVIGFWLA